MIPLSELQNRAAACHKLSVLFRELADDWLDDSTFRDRFLENASFYQRESAYYSDRVRKEMGIEL